MLTRLIVGILFQYIQILSKYIVYMKLICYMSIAQLKKENSYGDKVFSLGHDSNPNSLLKV